MAKDIGIAYIEALDKLAKKDNTIQVLEKQRNNYRHKRNEYRNQLRTLKRQLEYKEEQLAITEKALELACDEIGGCRNDCSLPYMNACNPRKCIYAVEDKPSYFKTKAEEMMKSE